MAVASSTPLKAGQVIESRYRLVHCIHAGAAGGIWSCVDLASEGRPCVLKLLGPVTQAPAELIAALLLELDRARQVDHPNLCRTLAAGHTEQMLYQVMEQVSGQNLRARLEAGELSAEKSFLILHQIFDALDAAHSHHIVHGRLSPAKIMLQTDGRVVMLGLGWRRSGELDGRTFALTVPPEHASPEQLRGEPADIRSDIYGMGLLMRHVLTGRAQLAQALSAPLHVADLATEQLQQLVEVLNRATARDRATRFRSVRQLSDAFQTVLFSDGTPTSSTMLRVDQGQSRPQASGGMRAGAKPAEDPDGELSTNDTATWQPEHAFALSHLDEPLPDSSVSFAALKTRRPAAPGPADDLATATLASTGDDARYQLEGEQGRGGSGRILRAFDRRLDRPVAVKLLLKPSANAAARFLREAMVSARLQHPSIVPVYDIGHAPNGELFYTMKLISGRSLQELLRQAGGFENRLKLLPHVIAVADAMAYAHSHHIIHRDLKPSNILVGDFGETVVIDWGLAKDVGDIASRDTKNPPSTLTQELSGSAEVTSEGVVVGTATYMAPEQAQGRSVDARADVYAIGAILLQLVTGQLPYIGPNATAVLNQVQQGPPPLLATLPAEVPADLAAIVRKAMARTITERYPSARELADDLRRFLTGQLVSAHEYSRMTLLGRWLNHYRLPVAMAGVCLLVLLGAAIAVGRSAVAERNRVEERNRELILVQARAALERDPTQTLAWLKLYPETGDHWQEARDLALDAYTRGVAEHVFRKTEGKIAHAAFSPDAQYVAAAGPAHTLRVLDLMSGRVVDHRTDNEFLSVRFSPDSTALVYSERDSSALRVWLRAADATRALPPASAAVNYFVLSPDGRLAAAAHFDGTLTIDEVRTGRRVLTTMVRGLGVNLRFSPSGQTLAYAGSDNAVHLFDLARGQSAVLPASHDSIDVIVYSARETYLAVCTTKGQATVYELASRRPLPLPRNDIANLAFAPSETALVTVGNDRHVRLWALPTLDEHSLGQHQERGIDVAYAPDGQSIASSGDEGGVRLWWPERATSRVLLGHRTSVYQVEYSVDSQRLLSVSPDRTARVWRLEPAPDRILHAEGRVSKVVYLPDGRSVVAIDDSGVWQWNRRSDERRRVLHTEQALLRSLAVSADGRTLAAGSVNGIVYLLDLTDLDRVRQRMLHGHDNTIRALVFSPDSSQLASADLDGTVRLWQVASGAGRVLHSHRGAVRTLAFSPDGRLLASAGDDATVRLRTLDTGMDETLPGHDKAIAQVLFSPDGSQLASASRDGTVRLWHIRSQPATITPTIVDRHSRAVRTIAFTPDGRTLVAGGDSKEVHLCPLPRGPCRILAGHRDWIETVAVSHDGRLIASAGGDSIIRLWDRASGLPVMIYRHAMEVTDVAFSPDDQELASTGVDQTVHRATATAAAPLMRSGHELRAWLDHMTSAVIHDGEPATP